VERALDFLSAICILSSSGEHPPGHEKAFSLTQPSRPFHEGRFGVRVYSAMALLFPRLYALRTAVSTPARFLGKVPAFHGRHLVDQDAMGNRPGGQGPRKRQRKPEPLSRTS
jgi:hypothetical protein